MQEMKLYVKELYDYIVSIHHVSELAKAAESPEQYNQIMGILYQRLQERGDNWRLCYKALLVIEFLCKQGPLVSIWGARNFEDVNLETGSQSLVSTK